MSISHKYDENFQKKFTIERCYDSHVHLLGTGILLKGLNLFNLSEISDLGKIELKSEYFKGEWLVGFGWDHHKWASKAWPTASDLDQYFPDISVAFSRADGHTTWLNTCALKKLGFYEKTEEQKSTPDGGVIFRNKSGYPTGIFQEHAKLLVDFAIPDYSRAQKRDFLLAALDYFAQNGFSHLRDMTGNIEQWEILKEMDESGLLNQYIEQNFVCENIEDFPRALREIQRARETRSPHLREAGIKIFFDGSLGSEGAYLSRNYNFSDKRGLLLWPEKDLEAVISESWKSQFEVAIHSIGDEAVHMAALCAQRVFDSGISGKINIEHSQVLRTDTISILKKLNAICHLQPCHYLNDRRWLKEKLGELYSKSFPWAALQENGIRFQFGSDSPIEPASIFKNFEALLLSAKEGIPELKADSNKGWTSYHSHPDINWGGQCLSFFENGKCQKVQYSMNLSGL